MVRKNGFVEGTFIATFGIILVKIIGLIYVIPFNAIIGEQGGALYGYAYTIYQLFLSISSAGFPFAISKITSEYSALGNKRAVYDTYKLSMKIIIFISLIVFLILFCFAPQIGKLILGSATGGNTYSDIAFVIRVISLAILVIPFLSVTKGFLQGYKYITPSTVSQIIEQVVRVIVILVGSYLCLEVFKIGLRNAVGVAVSGAFFGGLVACIYLQYKIKKSHLFPKRYAKEEQVVSNKEIILKIIGYSVPFIIISLVYNLYTSVDMILLSRTMSDILKMDGSVIESIISIYTTWGIKLNSIILAVSTGMVTSLIPNVVSSFAKGDMEDVNKKINKAIQIILLILVPLTLFLSLLAEPVWMLFYGESIYGPIVYKVFVFSSLFGALYTVIVNVLQGINKYKLAIMTVVIGLFINTVLDIPFILLAYNWGFNPSYGAVIAGIVGFSISLLISFYMLSSKYEFDFSSTLKKLPSYILSWLVFVGVIMLIKVIVPIDLSGRLIQIPILALFGIVSFGIYLVINYLNGNLNGTLDIFFKKMKKLFR